VVDQEPPAEEALENWAILPDPYWEPKGDDDMPPPEAMVGGWLLDENGNAGPFQPNPDYMPRDDTSPTDPADAVMRLIVEGQATIDDLIPVVQDAIVELAVTEDGYPLVGPAPDKSPCVAVATAAVHRKRVGGDNWAELTFPELVDVLPADTDILLNPGAPAATLLIASTLAEPPPA
jgi:hypothetical protein